MEFYHKYNKLVRDKIPEIIKESGKECTIVEAEDSLLMEYYIKKLGEEVQEVKDSDDIGEVISELADLYEVMDCFLDNLSIRNQVMAYKALKKEERGGFSNIILKEVVEYEA